MDKKLKWPEDFLNVKCVIYSLYIASIYWFLPRKNFFIIIITVINYFIINWYNFYYNCVNSNFIFNLFYTIFISFLLIFLPLKNKVILGFSLYFPYFILAWYDYFSNCSFRMNPTIFPFGRFIYLPIKPESYKDKFKQLDPAIKKNIENFDKYFFISIIIILVIRFINNLI